MKADYLDSRENTRHTNMTGIGLTFYHDHKELTRTFELESHSISTQEEYSDLQKQVTRPSRER